MPGGRPGRCSRLDPLRLSGASHASRVLHRFGHQVFWVWLADWPVLFQFDDDEEVFALFPWWTSPLLLPTLNSEIGAFTLTCFVFA